MPVSSVEQPPVPALEATPQHTAERPERRKRIRTRLHWQLDLLVLDHPGVIESATRDLSSRGLYCYSPVPLVSGERIVCILKIPTHHPEGIARVLPLECQIQVVRVEAADDQGLYGIACEIVDYRFLAIE